MLQSWTASRTDASAAAARLEVMPRDTPAGITSFTHGLPQSMARRFADQQPSHWSGEFPKTSVCMSSAIEPGLL